MSICLKDVTIENYFDVLNLEVHPNQRNFIASNSISLAEAYVYDKNGAAIWPKLAINYTMKTQFVFRISKGVDRINDDDTVNEKMSEQDRRVLYRNMIYLGDGITDIPCMRLVKDKQGKSIAVYPKGKKEKVAGLLRDKRVNYISLADYSENSELENIVKLQLEYIALLSKIEEKEKKQLISVTSKED